MNKTIEQRAKEPTSLTPNQKIAAFAARYYLGGSTSNWIPKRGDYYTSTRDDLELYKIVDETENELFTEYCNKMLAGNPSMWKKDDFLKGFGENRIHVPDYILAGATEAQDDWKRVEDELPKIGETVLVSDGVRVKEAFYCKRTDKDEPHFLFTTMKNITHWRNLPSPPSNE